MQHNGLEPLKLVGNFDLTRAIG